MSVQKNSVATAWPIAKLKDHPKQAEMFGDVSDADLEALAANMREHGQRDPVEITPDGTVIAGHQRVRAAGRLGWKKVDVVVRHDLAALGSEAIERRFVEDNFVRRQLSPLARAKCIKRLMELEEGRTAAKFGATKKEELKNRIAKRMELSLRSVNRYLLLLDTPVAIQAAFDKGEIPLVVAGKIALLDKLKQADIAKRVAVGENPASVVAEHTQRGSSGGVSEVSKAFGHLVRALHRDVPIIRGRLDCITLERLQRVMPTVRAAADLLDALVTVHAQKSS